jgi:hypothetical protein
MVSSTSGPQHLPGGANAASRPLEYTLATPIVANNDTTTYQLF